MVTHISTLLDYANRKWAIVLRGKLLDFDGSTQTSNSCSHHQNIVLHDLSLCWLHLGCAKQSNYSP